MNIRTSSLCVLACLFTCSAVFSQSFNGDARRIGLGGIGYSENIAAGMIEEQRQYSSFAVPLGILQLIQDRDRFDPDDEDFDPVLAMEYAASPMHYIAGRDPGGVRGTFVEDLVDGTFSRDLNSYRGFAPTNHLRAEGLANPSWGKTIKVRKGADGSFQGFYVGVGPYLSARTDLTIDQQLIDVLASPTPVSIPNRSFHIADRTIGQLALAVSGGYRARFSLPGSKGDGRKTRNGIYVGFNYHYLKGFRYEDMDIGVRLDTDSEGLVTVDPSGTSPVSLNYLNSRSGKGFALDLGVGVVADKWEFGFGANGVGNRINWKNLTLKQFSLDNLFEGGDFVEQRLPLQSSTLQMKLPVSYTVNAGYNERSWSAVAEVSHGFQGSTFRGGVEYRLGPIELRAGGRYGVSRWHPSGGIGLNMGSRFSIDVAAFGTTTNLERQLRPGIALSLRFNRVPS